MTQIQNEHLEFLGAASKEKCFTDNLFEASYEHLKSYFSAQPIQESAPNIAILNRFSEHFFLYISSHNLEDNIISIIAKIIEIFKTHLADLYLEREKKTIKLVKRIFLPKDDKPKGSVNSLQKTYGFGLADQDGKFLWGDKQFCWIFERSSTELAQTSLFDCMSACSKGMFNHKFGPTMFNNDEIDQIKFLTFPILRQTEYGTVEKVPPKVVSAKFFRLMLISPPKANDTDSKQECNEGVLIKARFSKSNKIDLYS